MLLFHDVLVSPFTELLHAGVGLSDHRGGPDWPAFDEQQGARHCRRGQPVDVRPIPNGAQPYSLDSCAWAGPTTFHFGHQIADFSMRLLPTLREWQDAMFLFGTHESSIRYLQHAPQFFLDLLAWFGINHEQVHLARDPVLVSSLYVAPQAEQFGGPGPSPDYLDALDVLTLARLGEITRRNTVFISRAATDRPVAGEAYLENRLRAIGITIVHPETLPLWDQLRVYASAEMVVFTEGSALHGTQLLGRALGDVLILNRRQGFRIGYDSLLPRAKSVRYVEVAAGPIVHGVNAVGRPAPWIGIGLFDEERLLEELSALGLPVRAQWRSADFVSARDADVARWVERESASPRGAVAGFHETVRETLAVAGIRIRPTAP